MLRADRLGGAQPFVGVGRRHPDVDDRHVRAQLPGGTQERVGVTDLRDHLEPGVDEQPCDALADEDRVVGQDEPEGHPASTSARIAAPETCSLGMKPRQAAVVRRRP